MRAEENSNTATRVDTIKIIGGSGRKKTAASAEWTVKEKRPATSQPPPENSVHRESKGEPSITERGLKVFSKRAMFLEYTLYLY